MAAVPPPPSGAALIDAIRWDRDGLVPAVVQQHDSGLVLMLAWMNRAAVEATLATGEAHYYSRSRQAQWRKGESSGQVQQVREIRLDCDGDALLLLVRQQMLRRSTHEAEAAVAAKAQIRVFRRVEKTSQSLFGLRHHALGATV